MTTDIQCPVCKGKGKLPKPRRKEGDRKKTAVRVLVDAGFSYREIMLLMGYKSPGSVQRALEQ